MQIRRVWRRVGDALTFSTDEDGSSTGTADTVLGFDENGDIEEIPKDELLASTSYTPDVTGAVVSDVETKLQERVTPADFGAVGDGVTDDTTALQAMIDNFKNLTLDPSTDQSLNNVAPVYIDLCGKSYLISSSLDFDRLYYVTFANGEIIADSGATWGTDPMLDMSATQVTDVVREQRIRNITFNGVKINGNLSALTCVYLENTFKVAFNTCYITSWATDGYGIKTSDRSASPVTKNTHLLITNTEASQRELCYLTGGFTNTGTAYSIETADFFISNSISWGCEVGFFFDNFYNGQLVNCHSFVGSAQECLVIGDNCFNLSITNFYSDTGLVTIKSFDHAFVGCLFQAGSQVNLEASVSNESGKGLIMDGCRFANPIAYTTDGINGSWATDKRVNTLTSLDSNSRAINGATITPNGNDDLEVYTGNSARWYFRDGGTIEPIGGYHDLGTPSSRLGTVHLIDVSFGGSGSIIDSFGAGSPEGVKTANIGSTYRQSDGGSGTTLWIKESGTGNTGWVAVEDTGGGTVQGTDGTYNVEATSEGAFASTTARGESSVDLQTERNAVDQVASGDNSVLIGGLHNKAVGTGSVVAGGTSNTATGNYSFATGSTNTVTSARGFVGGGINNDITSTGVNNAVVGGSDNDITGTQSNGAILGGQGNDVSGVNAVALGGLNNTASGADSLVAGEAATASHSGAKVFGDSSATPISSIQGNEFAIQASALRLVDGNEGAGKVLISDANGSGNWSYPVKPVYTVATLPATPSQGNVAMVTDATATTFHSVVAGTGSSIVPVFYDGTDWRIG